MSSARRVAVQTLVRIETDDAYSSLALKSMLNHQAALSEKDGALATRIVYGVTERKLTLDHQLSLYLKEPLKKLRPAVLACLRAGAYQILFMDKIPSSAAVNESVSLVKSLGAGYASGMVNAVLRKLAQNGLVLPPEQDDPLAYLSVKYSCPVPLLDHFIKHYGRENTEAHLSASLSARPLFIRRNTLCCTEESLRAALESENASAEFCAPEGCGVLHAAGDITKLSAFVSGWFHVQDLSSQYDAMLLGAKPGQTVVDCCAAPGGKSFTLAQYMENTGRLIACDQYEHKTALIETGARRLGLSNIETVCENAESLWQKGIEADAVLCDVPCSGYGVIGRKPEIRYKDPSRFADLPLTQYAILESGSRMVKPGGALVYSTCTLNPAENEAVCGRFLSEHPEFTVSTDPVYRNIAGGEYLTVFASPDGGDGFFAAKFERKPA